MSERGTQSNNGHHAGGLTKCLAVPLSNHKRVGRTERRTIPDVDLEEWLSSALLVADKKLGSVVREVDEISRALKSNAPDGESLRVVGHPAVWNAIRDVILERELRYLALTDDLTCFYNRRGFFAAATQQIKVARRNAQSMLLFFCDLDNLKIINDCYGHQEGDFALVRAADALEKAFRNSDILARLGGDEFVALALETASQSEDIILRRLEERLKKSNKKESRCDLSMSVGVARFDPHNEITLAELLAQADHAMYERKRERRDVLVRHAAAIRAQSSEQCEPVKVSSVSRG
jgi:diguanylate cyclase (GGDEF)-like protein